MTRERERDWREESARLGAYGAEVRGLEDSERAHWEAWWSSVQARELRGIGREVRAGEPVTFDDHANRFYGG